MDVFQKEFIFYSCNTKEFNIRNFYHQKCKKKTSIFQISAKNTRVKKDMKRNSIMSLHLEFRKEFLESKNNLDKVEERKVEVRKALEVLEEEKARLFNAIQLLQIHGTYMYTVSHYQLYFFKSM